MDAQEKIIRILMHFNVLKFKHLIKIHFIPNQVFLTFLPEPQSLTSLNFIQDFITAYSHFN